MTTIAEKYNWTTQAALLHEAIEDWMTQAIFDDCYEHNIKEGDHPLWEQYQAWQGTPPEEIDLTKYEPDCDGWRWAWNLLRHERSDYDDKGYGKNGGETPYLLQLMCEAERAYPLMETAICNWYEWVMERQDAREHLD